MFVTWNQFIRQRKICEKKYKFKFTDGDKKQMEEMFKSLDMDNKGHLDKNEFDSAVK